jgi:uncharacterized membrane protein
MSTGQSVKTVSARRGAVRKEANEEYDEKMSLGDRVSDRVAQFGGSWTFILIFGGVLLIWMFINSLPLIRGIGAP